MRTLLVTIFLAVITAATLASAQLPGDAVPDGKPDSVIDLATTEGVQLVHGTWRYSDTKIVETEFTAPGEDGQPSSRPVKTYDYEPHAGGADFDDSSWESIAPKTLSQRRANGRLCFNWYRITITIPEHIGKFDPAGSTAVFETSIDDYAEIWVDGELARGLGQQGGSVVAGWNATNRLIVGRRLKPAAEDSSGDLWHQWSSFESAYKLHLSAIREIGIL
jgi:gluconolactonase